MTRQQNVFLGEYVLEHYTELAMLALKEVFYIPLLAVLRIEFLQSETLFFAESNKNL